MSAGRSVVRWVGATTGDAVTAWLKDRGVSEGRALLAAATFLTRVPLADRVELDGDDVRRSGLHFPLVGAGVGAAVGMLGARLAPRCSAPLAAALAVGAGTVVTGALHLDALADTSDGLGAGSRERALEVMRDPTIGAFGATAVGLDLAIKVLALSELSRRTGDGDGGRADAMRVAVAAGAVSRAVPVVLAAALPYARADGGTGTALTGGGAGRAAGAAALAVTVAVAADGRRGLVLAAVAGALGLGLAAAYREWLGGVTGDSLGAALELTEAAVLVAAVTMAPRRR